MLTTQTIQTFINEESKAIPPTGRPLSPKTIRNIHGLITSTLKFHDPRLTFNVTLPQNKVDYIELPPAQNVNGRVSCKLNFTCEVLIKTYWPCDLIGKLIRFLIFQRFYDE